MPIVSVVMPVLNGMAYLPQALESYAQNRWEGVELWAVDDGSQDGSRECLQASGWVDCLLEGPGQGPAAARNCALRRCSGEYVAFLDADDQWPAGSLRARWEALQGSPQQEVAQGRVMTQVEESLAPRLASRVLEQPRYAVNLGSALFRKSCLDRVGLLDESLRFDEDTDLWIRLWEEGVMPVRLEAVCLEYRLHDQNMTREAQDNARALLPLLKRHRDRMAARPEVLAPGQSLASYLGWS